MVTTPAAIPETIPFVLPTVATPKLLLVQVPPVVISDKVSTPSAHTDKEPVIGAGEPFTVIETERLPHVVVYTTVSTPGITPLTTPVKLPIVATEDDEILQVPPDVESVNTVIPEAHNEGVPEINAGIPLTVNDAVEKPQPDVYVIVAIPEETPMAIPEELPIAAIAVELVVHTPPVDASVNVALPPVQIEVEPDIAPGAAPPIVTLVITTPQTQVYVIVAVPAATPVTTPVVDDTVAILVLLLDQVPPETESVKVVVPPIQAVVIPAIGDGK